MDHLLPLVKKFKWLVFLGLPLVALANINYDYDPCAMGFGSSYMVTAFIFAMPVYLINALIEAVPGYFLFFRNRLGVVAILIANLISWPIFVGYVFYARYQAECGGAFFHNYKMYFVAVGEIGVILLEAIILKLILRDKVSLKKLFFASVVMNAITISVYLLWNFVNNIYG